MSDTLREVAKAICRDNRNCGCPCDSGGPCLSSLWDTAAVAVRALIRNETLEEAARVADGLGYECEGCGHICGNPKTDMKILERAGAIACCPERKMRPLGDAIRALKDKPVSDQAAGSPSSS